jgi:hypothetical protein
LQRRLDAAMAQRQFYEAHQILRTMQWRMLPQQQPDNNNTQMGQKNNPQAEEQQQRMVELLHSGCLAMCEGFFYIIINHKLETYKVENLKPIFSQRILECH